MVILLFVALVMPWHEVGRRVLDSELPRPRFHADSWCGGGCMGYEGFAVISLDRRGDPGVPPERLDAWVAEQRARGFRSFYLRAHREAPWSAVARVLEAAVTGGQLEIGLEVGPWHYLMLALVPEPSAPEVTISALPLPDPEGVLNAARERRKAGRPMPVLRLALPDDPVVETVLHALECHAGDDAMVRLGVGR
jgi:hypothetical protein